VKRTSSGETGGMVAKATSFKTICLPMENGETINFKYTEMYTPRKKNVVRVVDRAAEKLIGKK
jgi:hypothetical protein